MFWLGDIKIMKIYSYPINIDFIAIIIIVVKVIYYYHLLFIYWFNFYYHLKNKFLFKNNLQ